MDGLGDHLAVDLAQRRQQQTVRRPPEHHVVADAGPRRITGVCRAYPICRAQPRRNRHLLAVDQDVAVVAGEPGQRPQQGRLAGTVRTDDADQEPAVTLTSRRPAPGPASRTRIPLPSTEPRRRRPRLDGSTRGGRVTSADLNSAAKNGTDERGDHPDRQLARRDRSPRDHVRGQRTPRRSPATAASPPGTTPARRRTTCGTTRPTNRSGRSPPPRRRCSAKPRRARSAGPTRVDAERRRSSPRRYVQCRPASTSTVAVTITYGSASSTSCQPAVPS